MTESAIQGCLLGTALGDAIGLPYEGLSRQRVPKLLGPPQKHRLLFGKGMVSDDTEHTCMVAQSLIKSSFDPQHFAEDFSKRLRYWLLTLPAGVGLATLKSILRLWVGYSPQRSGVYSAGNGPAMRSGILGVVAPSQDVLNTLVHVSTRMTHSDPKAEAGASAIALAARFAAGNAQPVPREYLDFVQDQIGEPELLQLLSQVVDSVEAGRSTDEFARTQGWNDKVTGYVYQTVPVAIHSWLESPTDFRQAVMRVIRCGGDTDTTAAIVGGIVGAGVGRSELPEDWIAGLAEWPRSVAWLDGLGSSLYQHSIGNLQSKVRELPIGLVFGRNLLFLSVVMSHGFRRLLPPY